MSCQAISPSLHQTRLFVKSPRSKNGIAPLVPKTKLVCRCPAWCLRDCPLVRVLPRSALSRSAHFYVNISIKHHVSKVKEEAVQPCFKEKYYPSRSAEDCTADHRTTGQYHPAGLVGRGDDWCSMRAAGWLGTSFALKTYDGRCELQAHEEGGVRVVRLTRGWLQGRGQASEHRARAMWVNMLLCARWEVTDLYFSLRTFCTSCISLMLIRSI